MNTKRFLVFAVILLLISRFGQCADDSQSMRVILCFGDSLTAGNMLSWSDKGAVWPTLVEKESGGRMHMINEGKVERTTASVGEFRSVLRKFAETKIDVVVFALGTNDSKDLTTRCVPLAVANLKEMITLVRKGRPGVGVLIVGPSGIRKDALSVTMSSPEHRAQKLRELNVAFETLSQEMECGFVSLLDVVPPESLKKDGIHPDVAGNQLIARAISDALTKLISK